jgi:hypothetical protein
MKKLLSISGFLTYFLISFTSGAFAQCSIPMPASSTSWPTSMTRSYNKLGWVIQGSSYRDATSTRMVIPNGIQDPAFGVDDYNSDPHFTGG